MPLAKFCISFTRYITKEKKQFLSYISDVYSKNSPVGCCGGRLYNTNDKVCCPLSSSISKPIKKKERDHTDCCIKTQKSYNRFNQSQAEQCVTGGRALKPCPYCDSSLSSTFCEKKSGKYFQVLSIKCNDYP